VLIHTDLAAAMAEMRRVLRPGGVAVLVEPLARNPLVNLYRATLAPKEWHGITRYFTEERVAMVRAAGWSAFDERRFHLLGFGAYAFQFAVRSPAAMRGAMALVRPVDRLLMSTIPPLRRLAWFTVMTCRRGRD
jgi:SAM-dependent methyltransferase